MADRTIYDLTQETSLEDTDRLMVHRTSAATTAKSATVGLVSGFAAGTPGGRLTLTTAVPVTTSDVTGATTVYYTPYVSNTVTLWDGNAWTTVEFTEVSHSLGTVTSGKPYDVFGYLSSGALALEKLVWTDDTTRATGVSLQDGRYCKTGDKTRLYLGTFYTTSTTATEDSYANRYLWNMYNQVHRRGLKAGTNNSYSSSTERDWNNDTSTRVYFVVGLDSSVNYRGIGRPDVNGFSQNSVLNMRLDNTTNLAASFQQFAYDGANSHGNVIEFSRLYMTAPGRHYLTLRQQEYSGNSINYNDGLCEVELLH